MTALEVTLLAILAALYLAMLIFLGVTTLRNGRLLFFVLGIFMPLFWIVGAILPPVPTAAAVAAEQAEQDRLYAR